jgi:pyrroloquinoline quinone biosynthesis protein B
MADYLRNNGPWQQLTTLDNIHILPLQNNVPIQLSPSIAVTPIQVPHRDEYSETVGYRIQCGQKRILFIPDIDKWEKWSTTLTSLLDSTDIAFLDATFYDASELPNRNIKEVPHPFVSETIQLLGEQSARLQKVHFIHYNHTNPLLYQPKVVEQLLQTGAHMALQGQWY